MYFYTFWQESSWKSTLLKYQKFVLDIKISLYSADVIMTSRKMPFLLCQVKKS